MINNPEIILIGAIVIAIFATLIYLIKQNKKIMTSQERIDAANEKFAAAATGIAADLRTLIDEAKNGNVSEESIAKTESLATLFEQLDAENTEPEAPSENAGE